MLLPHMPHTIVISRKAPDSVLAILILAERPAARFDDAVTA